MVSLSQGRIESVPLKKALDKLKLVDVEQFYNTKNYKTLDQII